MNALIADHAVSSLNSSGPISTSIRSTICYLYLKAASRGILLQNVG